MNSTSNATMKNLCSARPRPIPPLPPGLALGRMRAIIVGSSKWVNATQLHYYFLADENPAEGEKNVVRESFQEWKGLGIGLDFTEVAEPAAAEIRIGFDHSDGSWSYVGRDVLDIPTTERTMNFGWSLTKDDYGRTTALHEIGHTLGMPHEHQNPFAGIVWDEDAVYAELGGPPNNWDRDTTFHNVLRKLSRNEVTGSSWDPDSIMEYEFPAGLIISPDEYKNGVFPPGTLSEVDSTEIRKWYPGADVPDVPETNALQPFVSTPMTLAPAEQRDFEIVPDASRDYSIGSFGSADVVLVLFEQVDDELRYLAGDDDSGEERNALISVKLFAGRTYVARLRMYYAWGSGESAIMYW